MKIEYLSIDKYKNLSSFRIDFEKNLNLIALAGKNGSGKSNILEVIAHIFSFIMTDTKELGFTFELHYKIRGDSICISNNSGELKILKNNKLLPKTQHRSIIPITVFLYYAGETERLKKLAIESIDKTFNKCIKNGENPSYKAISYLSINDFGLSLMAISCFYSSNVDILKTLEETLGITNISKECKLYLKRPSWGKSGKQDNYWNAKGYIKELLDILDHNSSYKIVSNDNIILTLSECSKIQDHFSGPEGLFKALKILSQAEILDYIKIDVTKDSIIFDCNELSEGEKQLGNLLSILNFTRDYSALFLLNEFDSYLHPTWQRHFAELVSLKNITGQVLFTTHSPFTLSQMKRHNVFLLKNGTIYESSVDTYNRNASEIMEELMDISLRPKHIEELISNFNKAIAQKNILTAKQLKEQLHEYLSDEDPFFITADLSIARIDAK